MSNGSAVIEHNIKIKKCYFISLIHNKKPFEIRLNDRFYQTGQIVKMNEIDDDTGLKTGRYVIVKILSISSYQQKDNWIVWGHEILEIN